MKNLERLTLMAATGILAVGMGGCNEKPVEEPAQESAQEPTKETTEESEEIAWTEADIAPAVAGIKDVTVLQGAEEPNLLHGITYDGEIVESIEPETDADLTKPGTYKVTYTVTVNTEKLAEYLAEKYTSENAQYTVEGQAVIVIEKELTVVEPEKATEMADNGQFVIGSGDTTVPKSDGTFVEEIPNIPESVEEKGIYPVDATTKEEIVEAEKNKEATEDMEKKEDSEKDETSDKKASDKSSKDEASSKNTSKGNSGTESTSSGGGSNNNGTSSKNNSSSSSKNNNSSSNAKENGGSSNAGSSSANNTSGNSAASSEKPHTHTWVQQYKTVDVPAKTHTVHHDAQYKTVHHDAVTHQEPIYEAHQICNNCGADFGTDVMAMIDHSGEFGHSYRSEEVQIGTRTVVDQDAYDEQVLVKEAYDETIVDSPATTKQVADGYVCSECGARK